jgi:hypothetical protein
MENNQKCLFLDGVILFRETTGEVFLDGDHLIGYAPRLEDGYYYFDFLKKDGVMSSNDLKMIASFLDEINEPWDKQVKQYFSEIKHDEDDDVVDFPF